MQKMPETKKICIVLAGKTDFSVEKATSVDLYVHHYALVSRFKSSTFVIADARGRPLPNIGFHNLAGARRIQRLRMILEIAAKHRPSILVVHQNVKYANALGNLINDIPIVFVQHRLRNSGNWLASYFLHGVYKKFSHIVCVSDAARKTLVNAMPDLAGHLTAVPSGLNMRDWVPATDRLKQILVVGRCIPQKGIQQAALAIHQALQNLDDWSAKFILSMPKLQKVYVNEVLGIISAMGKRATLITNAPNDVVKHANEQAAIALVPSLGDENFARTALEAHAGGAALISSGYGALKEISGDFACYVNPENTGELAQSIIDLATNERQRDYLAREGASRARAFFDINCIGKEMDDLLDRLSSNRTATASGNVTLAYLKSKYLT